MDRTLQQHINDDRDELDNPNTSGQRRRHLEGELDALEQYQVCLLYTSPSPRDS